MNRLATVFMLIAVTIGPCLLADGPQPRDPSDLTSLTLEQLMDVTVQTASLHQQSLADAPASVTVITRAEIQKYGYRTLADALRYVTGFYISNDRSFDSVGVRGFSLPGDYSSRVLVLINGHNMSPDLNSDNAFGEDSPLDLSLVKQIEIVRGPASALYGSGGVLATINIITEAPRDASPEVRVETDSLGEKKIQATSPLALGKNATMLVSASVFNDAGQHDIYIPELNSPATNYGQAINMDGERGYHFFAELDWNRWSITAGGVSRSWSRVNSAPGCKYRAARHH